MYSDSKTERESLKFLLELPIDRLSFKTFLVHLRGVGVKFISEARVNLDDHSKYKVSIRLHI